MDVASPHQRPKGLKRRDFFETSRLQVKLDKDARFFGLEQLTLNNMCRIFQTMLMKALGYQVWYEAAGVKVPATGYVRLTVNGRANGLYSTSRRPDTQVSETPVR